MMGTVRPPDIVLTYLKHVQKGTRQEIIKGINSLIKSIVPKGVYSAIDFNFYKHNVRSDVIGNILWEFDCSGLIKETDGVYEMTKYGNKIVDQLLQSFRKSDDYKKVHSSLGSVKS